MFWPAGQQREDRAGETTCRFCGHQRENGTVTDNVMPVSATARVKGTSSLNDRDQSTAQEVGAPGSLCLTEQLQRRPQVPWLHQKSHFTRERTLRVTFQETEEEEHSPAFWPQRPPG